MPYTDSDDHLGNLDDLPEPPDFDELIDLEAELDSAERKSRAWIEKFQNDEGLFDEPQRILTRFKQMSPADRDRIKETLESERPTVFAILFGDPVFIVERALSLPEDKAEKLMQSLSSVRKKEHKEAEAILADLTQVLAPLAQMSESDQQRFKETLKQESPTVFALLLGEPGDVLGHVLLLEEADRFHEFMAALARVRPKTHDVVKELLRDQKCILERIEQMPKADRQQIKEIFKRHTPPKGFAVLFGDPPFILDVLRQWSHIADEIMDKLATVRPQVHQAVQRELDREGAEPEPEGAGPCADVSLDVERLPMMHRIEFEEEDLIQPRTHRPQQIFGSDSVCCHFLSRGAQVRQSVGRVLSERGTSIGTAFLIAPNLLMTNRHVFERKVKGKKVVEHEHVAKLRVEFDHLPDMQSQIHQLLPHELLHFSQRYPSRTKDELDYAIVYVAPKSNNDVSLDHRRPIQLKKNSGNALNTERVNIVQHPGQHSQVLVLRGNEVHGPLNKMLLYSAATTWGSSGSPVLNDQWVLAALHRRTVPFVRRNERTKRREVFLKDGKDKWIPYPQGNDYYKLRPRFKMRGNAGTRGSEIYKELENLLARTGKAQTWSTKVKRLIADCLRPPTRGAPDPGKGRRNLIFRNDPSTGNGEKDPKPVDTGAWAKAFTRDVAAWNRLSKARDR